jgi:periplasmic protein TonB
MSIQEKVRYGAAELKSVYSRNLGIALGVSVAAHLVLIGLYIFSTTSGSAGSANAGTAGPVKMTKLPPPPPPPAEEFTPPPPPPPMIPPEMATGGGGTGGVLSIAGNPVPTPDVELAPDAPEFSGQSEITMSNSKAGDGSGFGGVEGGEGFGNAPELPKETLEIKQDDAEKEYEAFEFTEAELPKYDEAELMRTIKYPELARSNSLEGVVTVQFVVNTEGRAEKIEVVASDQNVFNAAAMKAIKDYQFTPAYQQGKAVRVRMTIPVRFTLSE